MATTRHGQGDRLIMNTTVEIETKEPRLWERNGHGGKPPARDDSGDGGGDDGRFRRGHNNLPEGPWCGHPMVDVQTRRCANDDCRRELPPGAWERLQNAPFVAPPGQLWVFNETVWDGWDEGDVERPESYHLSLQLIDSAG
jgi:hypothetical protein